MAEVVGAVTAALKLGELIVKLGFLLVNLKGALDIKDDVKNLHDELKTMQCFILDAEKIHASNLFQEWIREVSVLVDESSDVANKIISRTSVHTSWQIRLRRYISFPIDLCRTNELKIQIKSILKQSINISDRKKRFDLNADRAGTNSYEVERQQENERRRNQSHASLDNVVGLADILRDLTHRLTNESSDQFLISIVGMSGIGKTTLARKLYDTVTKSYFQCHAWIYVSSDYKIRDLLMELINSMIPADKQIPINESTLPHSMERCLRDYLKDQRFLVVVDDLCSAEDWESLKNAFPDSKGSRVIITTKYERVAVSNKLYVHNLRNLNDDESWDLFCSKALPPGKECESSVEVIGKEMVAECSGLPRAIVTLAANLAGKTPKYSEWISVRNKTWEEREGYLPIRAMLAVSFKELPKHLQLCFLYVAMFPEEHIKRSRLMLLWEAEDFIKEGEQAYTGDATKAYFNELVIRSLFTKISEDWIDSTFRVNNILRHLAIRMARNIGFSIHYDGKHRDICMTGDHKRLVVFCSDDAILDNYSNPLLRTLRSGPAITENAQDPSTSSQPQPQPQLPFRGSFQTLHDKFRWLKVLDVQISTVAGRIPKDIGKLNHLRFLAFQFQHSFGEYMLPDTLGELEDLQTLFIPSGLVKLPKKVFKLTKVKHLIGNFIFLSDQIGSFGCLETLAGISGDQWCRLNTTMLVNLRRLKLWNIKNVQKRFYDNFRNLTNLNTLTLHCDSGVTSGINLERIFELCPNVSHLETVGISFSNSHSLDTFAQELVVLECELNGTEINDSISSIGKLSKLEALHLLLTAHQGETETETVCFNDGFSQLRSLKITGNSQIIVEGTCMTSLEHLEANHSPEFRGADRLMHHYIEGVYMG